MSSKRFLSFVVACAVTLFFIIVPLRVSAYQGFSGGAVYLDNDSYQAYVNRVVNSNVSLMEYIDENKFTSSSAPKPSSSSGGLTDVAKEIGSEVLKYLIKDILTNGNIHNPPAGVYIPEYTQMQGKLRNEYANQIVEIITCCVTYFQTPNYGDSGVVESYDSHMILSFIRQINDYYTTFTICDTDSLQFSGGVDVYGDLSSFKFTVQQTGTPKLYFSFDTQSQAEHYSVSGVGSVFDFRFFNTGVSTTEWKTTAGTGKFSMFSYPSKGIPTIESGTNYFTIQSLLGKGAGTTTDFGRGTGLPFTTSYIDTNSYPLAVQSQSSNPESNRYSINYRQNVSNNVLLNQDTYNDFGDLINNVDNTLTLNEDNYNSWVSNYNSNFTNNTYNTYNYYYQEQPPSSETTTVTTTMTTTTTTTTNFLPPSSSVTYPPATLPSAKPKYTLDMTAVSSDLQEIKNRAKTVNVTRSFWLIKLMDSILDSTGFLPVFFFCFLLSLLGVLLWK